MKLSIAFVLPFLPVGLIQAASQSPSEIRRLATPVTVGHSNRVVQHALVLVNGRAINFGGTRLEMRGGRLYVPLRSISEAAGAIVRYEPKTQTISIQRGTRVVQLHTKVTPRVLVPLRFLSESLGAQVELSSGRVRGISEIYINFDMFGPDLNKPMAPPRTPTQDIRQQAIFPPPRTNVLPKPDVALQAAIQHNLHQLNAYRARAGAQALQLDPKLNAFAQQGSLELKQNHIPHGHFQRRNVFESGFQGGAAENQGDPNGWPIRGGLNTTIDAILQAMIDEGPGGGHHDNMLNPKFRRVGIGLVVEGNELYLTNDFSQ
ncbi:MAG TPA: stalk domain-containing protein [Abditibacteriaceae bacterium]|jgi:uncharacterized protein YkwD